VIIILWAIKVLNDIVDTYDDVRAVKVIKASCAVHTNIFVGIIKKYIIQTSSLVPLSELKSKLQLGADALIMIDTIQDSYLRMPSKQQATCFCEIFEKVLLLLV
jgi:hypothetical protein